MRKNLFTFSAYILISVLFFPSLAQTEFFSEDYGASKQLDIVVGESKVVTVSKPTRIAIGDPAVADVAGASNTEMIVAAKRPGETNLQIWDALGQREIRIRIFEEDLNQLRKRLQDLFSTA
ncbi:MAG TPA: pilus assembly protein N-terminal domain-containing protein, partial [Candidatus Omnitrophota bacterium]|nr:pilus assembly protein N-terminal domain-containing protein [Candidatus Omnitrophota bacterium]